MDQVTLLEVILVNVPPVLLAASAAALSWYNAVHIRRAAAEASATREVLDTMNGSVLTALERTSNH